MSRSPQPLGVPLRVAVLSFDDPWASSHGGTQRTQLFLEAIESLGHIPICVYAGSAVQPPLTDPDSSLVRVGVESAPLGARPRLGRISRLKRRFLPLPTIRGGRVPELERALAANGPYDVLITQQLRGVPYLRQAPGAKLWLDQTDLWSRFAEIEVQSRRGLERLTARAQQKHFVREERKAARIAGVITAAGDGDRHRLKRTSGRDVAWLPPAVLQLSEPIVRAQTGGRPTAGLLGNFEYWPNRDAFEVLRSVWLPQLLAKGWDVVVAGYGSERYRGTPGITVLGALDNPSTFYEQIDVSLAPIRLGAGIKVKVLEALFAGRPVFASSPALEGFPPDTVPGAFRIDIDEPNFPAPPAVFALNRLVGSDVAERSTRTGFRRSIKAGFDALR